MTALRTLISIHSTIRPTKCNEVKQLFEESTGLMDSAITSQASKAAQDAATTTTIAAAAGGFIVVLVLVVGIYCTRKGGDGGGGAGAGHLNASGGVIAFENPNYDFNGAAGGKYNPAYSDQFAEQGPQDGSGYMDVEAEYDNNEGGEGLYDDAAFAWTAQTAGKRRAATWTSKAPATKCHRGSLDLLARSCC